VPPLCSTLARALCFLSSSAFSRNGGYQGPRAAEAAAATGKWIIEIVKRNELHKFVVLPKRWIVIDCTMLPSRALIGHRSSNAEAAGGNRYSFR